MAILKTKGGVEMKKMISTIYFILFLLGCISTFSLGLYILSFVLYLNHLDQPLPGTAFIPKEIFLLTPLIGLGKRKDVQETLEKLEKIFP